MACAMADGLLPEQGLRGGSMHSQRSLFRPCAAVLAGSASDSVPSLRMQPH